MLLLSYHTPQMTGDKKFSRKLRLGEKFPETLRPRGDPEGRVTNSMTARSAASVNFFVDKSFQNLLAF